MPYLKNTLTNYKTRVIDGYEVADYSSIDLTAIRTHIKTLPETAFDYIQIHNNDKWERVSLEIYGNPDYWDILLILNNRNPLTGLPFDFDTVSTASENMVLTYELSKYKQALPTFEHELLYLEYEEHNLRDNESNRIIKFIRPSQINIFLQSGYDLGVF